MATNEILPFASTNTGTNLLTQAEYTSDAQRTIGHQPGIARSKLENKVLRQASLIAAGLAEFIADYQANNVTDSLTPQNIADYLVEAIAAVAPVTPDATESVKGKIEIATSAEAAAGTDATRAITPLGLRGGLNATGNAPVYACRAWVNFNGHTRVISGSGNVTSITYLGAGYYRVNFDTPMTDIAYCAVTDGQMVNYVNVTRETHTGLSGDIESQNYVNVAVGLGGNNSAPNINIGTFTVAVFR